MTLSEIHIILNIISYISHNINLSNFLFYIIVIFYYFFVFFCIIIHFVLLILVVKGIELLWCSMFMFMVFADNWFCPFFINKNTSFAKSIKILTKIYKNRPKPYLNCRDSINLPLKITPV